MKRRRRMFYASCVLSVVGWGVLLGPAAAAAALGICLMVAATA